MSNLSMILVAGGVACGLAAMHLAINHSSNTTAAAAAGALGLSAGLCALAAAVAGREPAPPDRRP